MRVVDWFSGIGGFSLGLEMAGGFETVAFSEIDSYACRVLKKHWPGVPNMGDVRDIQPQGIPTASLWTGGIPCQPFSVAGKRGGAADERHLWPAWFRLIRVVRPRYLLVENVPGLLTDRAALEILGDLAAAGYDAEWAVIGAHEVGAPHRRDRLWTWAEYRGVVADTSRGREFGRQDDHVQAGRDATGRGDTLPDALRAEREPGTGRRRIREGDSELADDDGAGQPNIQGKRAASRTPGRREPGPESWWNSEPNVGRVAHGIPARVDRLRCLGNAVVPQVVAWIGERIKAVT